jgi:ABC-type transport system involved in multi-copper enzyme maturation permease subunit
LPFSQASTGINRAVDAVKRAGDCAGSLEMPGKAMYIDTQFDAFLEKRRKLITAWSVAGPLSLLSLAALFAWLYLRNPLLVNPVEVADRLESGAIDEPTLAIMSLLLPVTISLCFLVLIVMILFVYAAISREKKYLQVIDRLAGGDDG